MITWGLPVEDISLVLLHKVVVRDIVSPLSTLMYSEVYGVPQWSPVVVLSCRVLFLLFLEIIFIIVDVEFGCPGFGLFFPCMLCFVAKSSQPLSIPSFLDSLFLN